jgi:hypothetical protein
VRSIDERSDESGTCVPGGVRLLPPRALPVPAPPPPRRRAGRRPPRIRPLPLPVLGCEGVATVVVTYDLG